MKGLSVIDETDVGWDEHAPPNETVDANGNPFPSDRGFGVADPRAPGKSLRRKPGLKRRQLAVPRKTAEVHVVVHAVEL